MPTQIRAVERESATHQHNVCNKKTSWEPLKLDPALIKEMQKEFKIFSKKEKRWRSRMSSG